MKDKKHRLTSKAKKSEKMWWGFADNLLFLFLKLTFFFILVVMVSHLLQALL